MEFKKVFLFVVVVLLGASFSWAQDDSKFGDDPETCRIKLSTYDQYYKQGNIKDAVSAWRWCFLNCPESTKNIYIHGTSIVEYLIESAASDEELREKYIDTLLMVYDKRIEYFGEEGKVLGRKANDLLKYRPSEIQTAYEMYQKSIESEGNETERSVLGNMMSVSVVLYKNGTITDEEVVNNYAMISDIIGNQIESYTAAGKDKYVAKSEELAAIVEELFVNSGAANCSAIISLYTPKFNENPEDIDQLKKIIALLERGKEDECMLSDLYSQVAEKLYSVEKSTTAAHSLAQLFFKRSEPAKAEGYYLEAIELAEEDAKKADLYYELALLYYSQMKLYAKSRDYARKALAIDPNYGRAYILIGKDYASGSTGCGENDLEKSAIYWVVVDQFVKAKSVDSSESVVKEANELIGKYTTYFPTTEKAFWYDVQEGQSVTVGCWINETTTARFIN
jgi:tetratricopeptide (TPR) repeat protein